MRSEDLDAVFEAEPEKAGEVSTPPAEAPKEPEKAPEEPKQPEPAPEAPKDEPKQPEANEHTVPLAKYLDTRDELKELRRWKAEQEAKAQPPAKIPDPVDDPDGFRAHLKAEYQRDLTAKTFEISDQMARQAHGAETVEKATEWALSKAQNDPVFAAQYMREAHPIDWIVRQHKRDGIVSQLPADISSLDELIEREIAKRSQPAPPAGEVTKPATEPPAAKPAAPTKSLIDQPSGGGVTAVPLGALAGIDAVFTR